MAFSYSVHADLNLLFMRYSGCVSLNDQRRLVRYLASDDVYRPELAKLCDSSSLVEANLRLSDLIALRDRLHARYVGLPGPILWAHYAPSDYAFGMARMWNMLLEEIPAIHCEVFSHAEETLEFLGMNRPEIANRLGLAI
ncbi:hypothetical protein [Tropicimonas marinistellae]|uniref:hypothetical protein n=1 Tax=Tropicimonas marinistellae TaxID=1739787 RepID=UPI00122E7826|nr:hypothetical protein [Tropicimonas marinistellae]